MVNWQQIGLLIPKEEIGKKKKKKEGVTGSKQVPNIARKIPLDLKVQEYPFLAQCSVLWGHYNDSITPGFCRIVTPQLSVRALPSETRGPLAFGKGGSPHDP